MKILSESTSAVQRDIRIIIGSPDTAQADQIAKLTSDIQFEKDRRKHEEFCFVLAIIVLFDVIAFRDLSAFACSLVTVVELVLIVVVGRFCGVEDIEILLDKAFSRLPGLWAGQKPTESSTTPEVVTPPAASTPSISDLRGDAEQPPQPSDTV